jgi:hypothetical protein
MKNTLDAEILYNKIEEDIPIIEEEKNITFKKSELQTVSEQEYNPEFSSKKENKETLLFGTQNINNFTLKNTTISEHIQESISHSDYSKLEAYKIELENELGDYVFASIYRKIDDIVLTN